MRTLEEVAAEIRAIPTVAELVAFLLGKGIKGRVRDGERCPLANYIRREVGQEYKITDNIGNDGELASGCATVLDSIVDDEGYDGEREVAKLCNVANTFIREFDSGNLPELAE